MIQPQRRLCGGEGGAAPGVDDIETGVVPAPGSGAGPFSAARFLSIAHQGHSPA